MPINYKNYPPNWRSEIRPAILNRADNCCENCSVPNYAVILRGWKNGEEVYQTDDFEVCNALDSAHIGYGDIDCAENAKSIKVVLTIAHLDWDIKNNDFSNLAALCQQCHLRHDIKQHVINRRITYEKDRGLVRLF